MWAHNWTVRIDPMHVIISFMKCWPTCQLNLSQTRQPSPITLINFGVASIFRQFNPINKYISVGLALHISHSGKDSHPMNRLYIQNVLLLLLVPTLDALLSLEIGQWRDLFMDESWKGKTKPHQTILAVDSL